MAFRIGYLIPRVSAHSERDLFAWSLLAGIILLCLLALPFFSGGLYTADDLADFRLPARAFYAQQLARGDAFDWMPNTQGGLYLTGDGQMGTYHPLHHLLYRFLPLHTALSWEYLMSYPFMLWGMYFLLRRRLRRRDAAMMGSLAFTFSSFNLLHFVHPNEVAAVAHIPWLLAMIDIVLVDAKRWKVASAQGFLALLTGSQLLLGCPQFVWYSLLAETCFAAFLLITRRYVPRDGCEAMPTCRVCVGCRHSSLSCVIVAKAVGLLVGAVQLLPIIDSSLHSTLAGDGAASGVAILYPINLVQLIAPYMPIDRAFGGSARELSLYVGAVPLMLALWVFARPSELGGLYRLAQTMAFFALAAIVLAMGSRLTATSPSAPWISWFHFSCRYTVLFQFAVAVLAAIGFVLVERESRETGKIQRLLPLLKVKNGAANLWRQYEVLGGAVLVSVAVAIAGLILQFGHHVASPARVLVGPLLMAAAALLVMAAARGVRGALVGLILFTAADLGYYGLSCTLDEANARPETQLTDEGSPVCDPLPPARLVTRVVQSDHPADDLARIDLRREALCEYALALPPGKPGTAAITNRSAGQIAVNVCCSSPQLLVLTESYHPGWRCLVDGTAVPAYRVNGDFLGCVVDSGSAEVRWDFRPDSLRRGRLLTLTGLGLIGLCLFSGASRRELALVDKIGLSRPGQ